jgi:hypothetical protein
LGRTGVDFNFDHLRRIKMEDIVIVSALRTAVGKFGGALAKTQRLNWGQPSSRR